MKRQTTTVNYRVPSWPFCNHEYLGSPTDERCRFCVEAKHGRRTVTVCVMYNVPVDLREGILVAKCAECLKKSKSAVDVEEVAKPRISVKELVKLTIDKYHKHYNNLRKEGYPHDIADKYATEFVLTDD